MPRMKEIEAAIREAYSQPLPTPRRNAVLDRLHVLYFFPQFEVRARQQQVAQLICRDLRRPLLADHDAGRHVGKPPGIMDSGLADEREGKARDHGVAGTGHVDDPPCGGIE